MLELKGRTVTLTWARNAIDEGDGQVDMWHRYFVEEVDLVMRALRLQGVNDVVDGVAASYVGGAMWVPLEHIACLALTHGEEEEHA